MAITASQVKELREITGLGMMECKKALDQTAGNLQEAIDFLRKNSALKAAKKSDRTAAEGRVVVHRNSDKKQAWLLEVNSETDFVARDENFMAFCDACLAKAVETNLESLDDLLPHIQNAQDELVQKIGEKIQARRLQVLKTDSSLTHYIHTDAKIAAVVAFAGDNEDAARGIAMHIAAMNPSYLAPDAVPQEVVEKEKAILLALPDMQKSPEDKREMIVKGRLQKYLAELCLLEQAFVKDQSKKVGQFAKESGISIEYFHRLKVGEGIHVEKTDFAEEVRQQAGL